MATETKITQIIRDEVNPAKDMKVVEKAFQPQMSAENTVEKDLEIFLLRGYTVIKPTLRGGCLGALAGTLLSLCGDGDIAFGAALGAGIGYIADGIFYYPRAIYCGIQSITKNR